MADGARLCRSPYKQKVFSFQIILGGGRGGGQLGKKKNKLPSNPNQNRGGAKNYPILRILSSFLFETPL